MLDGSRVSQKRGGRGRTGFVLSSSSVNLKVLPPHATISVGNAPRYKVIDIYSVKYKNGIDAVYNLKRKEEPL